MRITGRVARSLFILLIAVATPGVIYADDATPSVKLLVGRSAIVDIGTPIQRVSLTSADVADAMVTASNQLLVNGKMPGTISMFVWERNGALHQYEIVVQRDLARLNEQMKRLFPNEAIDAQSNGKSIVLSGYVSTKETAALAASVAGGYVDKADDVVNLLKLQEGMVSNQVLLRVRFAEVSRTAVTDLGVGFFTSALGIHNTLGRVTTNQVPTPGFDELKWTKSSSDFGGDVTQASGKNTFSDFLNVFLFSEKYDIGVVIKALQTRGLFQSLAEPNLVSESGKEASFLAGGEFPVPIAQGTGGNVAISVMFKEFGIRLNFTPIVSGNRVHLKVRPEVSTLDFANGVTLQGFRIPALTTRRTETELELNDGQTFAIAGLLNNTVNSTMQKIPGIGDIPILGALFKSKAAQKDQTELVVMITPQIITRASVGVTGSLPRTPEAFLPPLPHNKTVNPEAPAFTPERPGFTNQSPSPQAVNPPKASANAAPGQKNGKTAPASPDSAAAAVSALTPATHAPGVVAAPAPAAAPAQATPAQERPLTEQERKVVERARAQEEAARKNDGVNKARQDEAMKRAAKAEEERQAKLAVEKAKQDREQARVAAIAAKRQAEIEKNHQKALDEAAQKAKEAQARYDAIAKSQKQ
jgi:pilus assembly protein CpaC